MAAARGRVTPAAGSALSADDEVQRFLGRSSQGRVRGQTVSLAHGNGPQGVGIHAPAEVTLAVLLEDQELEPPLHILAVEAGLAADPFVRVASPQKRQQTKA